MKVHLLIPVTSLALAAAVALPAGAQMPHDSMKNHVSDSISRQTQHWHFDGKVSTIDPGAHQITINADSIPQQAGGQTTLPYKVPASESLDRYHVGDVVHGDLVVRNNRSRVENVKLGPTPAKSAMHIGRRSRVHRDRGPAVSDDSNAGAATQRHPFHGVVSTVDANKITINAENIPGMKSGTTTLPYMLKTGSSTFKVGDKVTGMMVVRDNRTYVEKVRPASDNEWSDTGRGKAGHDTTRIRPQ